MTNPTTPSTEMTMLKRLYGHIANFLMCFFLLVLLVGYPLSFVLYAYIGAQIIDGVTYVGPADPVHQVREMDEATQ